MKIDYLNAEANKLWKRFGSKSESNRLNLELNFYKKLIEIYQAGNSYYFVFNFRTLEFDIVSSEIESVLGYKPFEATIPFLIGKLHPEDRAWFLAFEKCTVDFFSKLPIEKLLKYKVRYDFRVKKENDEYVRLLHQVVVAEYDEDGHIGRTLGVHSDISYLKQEGKPVLSFIGLDGEPSYNNININNLFAETKQVLTPREKQIVNLLIEGKLSKEISYLLNISKQTVDSHRKNILQKNNLNNTNELIGKAIRYGWV